MGESNLFISNLTRGSIFDKERYIAWSLGPRQRCVLEEELWYRKVVGDRGKRNGGREMGHGTNGEINGDM